MLLAEKESAGRQHLRITTTAISIVSMQYHAAPRSVGNASWREIFAYSYISIVRNKMPARDKEDEA